jgi:hypothetical protein
MAKKMLIVDTLALLDHHFLKFGTAEWRVSRDLSACLVWGMSGVLAFTPRRPAQPHDPTHG